MESHEEQVVPAGVDESRDAGEAVEPRQPDAATGAAGEVAEQGNADLIRDLVLRAYPDVVPELITGETAAEMVASVPAAREAYQRAVEAARAANPAPEPVPAGGGRVTIDIEAMPPVMKIREGLGRRE